MDNSFLKIFAEHGGAVVKKSTGRKVIDAYIKHEDIIDSAVKLGKANGLDVEPTEGNDPKGDIKVASKDRAAFLKLLGETIDQSKAKRSKLGG